MTLSPVMQRTYDNVRVSLSVRECNPERLPPELWESLRQRLQCLYRSATGETQATLTIEDQP